MRMDEKEKMVHDVYQIKKRKWKKINWWLNPKKFYKTLHSD